MSKRPKKWPPKWLLSLRPRFSRTQADNPEQAAKQAVRDYLVRLGSNGGPSGILDYEGAIKRADLARSLIDHPYWEILSRMLSGTIQSETESMLSSDDHLAVNRASVAICRKVLQMPFFDIEQGRVAENMYNSAINKYERRTGMFSGQPTSARGN